MFNGLNTNFLDVLLDVGPSKIGGFFMLFPAEKNTKSMADPTIDHRNRAIVESKKSWNDVLS